MPVSYTHLDVYKRQARIAMNRYMKRGGQVWIRIFPHLAKTKKPLEVRMGSGKMCIRDRRLIGQRCKRSDVLS